MTQPSKPASVIDRLTALDTQKYLNAFTTTLTARIQHYLDGHQLQPPDDQSDTLRYWTGELPPSNDPDRADVLRSLKAAFVPAGELYEVCERLSDSVVGLDNWRLSQDGNAPPPDSTGRQPEKNEHELMVTKWWDGRHIMDLLTQAGVRLTAHGRVVLRPVIPPAVTSGGRLQQARDDPQALSRVHWQLPDPTRAGIYVDEETLTEISVYAYQDKDGRSHLELSEVLDDGRTRHVILNGEGIQQDATYDLGGRLMLVQATLPRALGSLPMLANIDALNVARAGLNRNTRYAHWAQKIGIDLAPPGDWKRSADGGLLTDEAGNPIWEPQPIKTEGDSIIFLQSATDELITETPDSNPPARQVRQQARNGSLQRWEPLNPEALTVAMDRAERGIYKEARQLFALMADDATASGRSRETAMGDFLTAAAKVRESREGLTRDLLGLTLALVALQRPGTPLSKLRPVVNARVQAFRPETAELLANIQLHAAGAFDQEELMVRSGVTDPDSMKVRVRAEQEAKQARALEVAQAQATVSQKQNPATEGTANGPLGTL